MTPQAQPEANAAAAPAPGPTAAGTIIRIFIYVFFCLVGVLVVGGLVHDLTDNKMITGIAATFSAAAIANVICMRIYEQRSLAEVGLGWSTASVRHLGFGVLGGVGVAALIVLVPALFGLASWTRAAERPSGWGAVLFWFILILFGAVAEEFMFRGYGFQIMARRFGVWATLLPMGVLFAAVHSGNPNVSNFGLLNTFLWGVALGWCVLRSGDLWLAIGVHAGWNWTLPLLGVNLSGITMRVSGMELQWKLDPLWSGGSYGPEGGLLSLVAMTLLLVGLYKAPLKPQPLVLLLAERKQS
ncbi:MAG: CPBP family intramembrane glutamic endopeptidase [Acidobacteriota bacterium]